VPALQEMRGERSADEPSGPSYGNVHTCTLPE